MKRARHGPWISIADPTRRPLECSQRTSPRDASSRLSQTRQCRTTTPVAVRIMLDGMLMDAAVPGSGRHHTRHSLATRGRWHRSRSEAAS